MEQKNLNINLFTLRPLSFFWLKCAGLDDLGICLVRLYQTPIVLGCRLRFCGPSPVTNLFWNSLFLVGKIGKNPQILKVEAKRLLGHWDMDEQNQQVQAASQRDMRSELVLHQSLLWFDIWADRFLQLLTDLPIHPLIQTPCLKSSLNNSYAPQICSKKWFVHETHWL